MLSYSCVYIFMCNGAETLCDYGGTPEVDLGILCELRIEVLYKVLTGVLAVCLPSSFCCQR